MGFESNISSFLHHQRNQKNKIVPRVIDTEAYIQSPKLVYAPVFSGWLRRKGHIKPRFFVLRGLYLTYSVRPDGPPEGSGFISHVGVWHRHRFGLMITFDNGKVIYTDAEIRPFQERWYLQIRRNLRLAAKVQEEYASSTKHKHLSNSFILENSILTETETDAKEEGHIDEIEPCNGEEENDEEEDSLRDSFQCHINHKTFRKDAGPLFGWMTKEGQKYKSWKCRFFLIKGTTIWYSKAPGTSLKGKFTIENVAIWDGKPNGLIFSMPDDRKMYLYADSYTMQQLWYRVITMELNKANSQSI